MVVHSTLSGRAREMKSWRSDLPAETRELIRVFEAMHRGAETYGKRYMEAVGDFGEGMDTWDAKRYGEVFSDLTGQLEEVGQELCRLLGIEPLQWVDTEHDVIDGDTYAGAVSSHLVEMDVY